MEKALIVANLFHTSPRIPGFTTYLPEFGWEATIITPPPGKDFQKQSVPPKNFFDNVKIVEAPYQGDIFWFWRKIFKMFGYKTDESIPEQIKESLSINSKKSFIDVLLNFYQTFFAYPDTEKTWGKPALKIAKNIFKKEHFNIILSSSPFPTSHIIASKLKKKFNLPWVADFRDLWTQNHNYPYSRWRKIFEKRLELKTLSSANVLVTVSQPLADKLIELHRRETIYSITNGFDPEKINNPPNELSPKFTITYTGQIYVRKQDPLKIIVALKDLIEEGTINENDVEIRFYGPENYFLKKNIEKYGLDNIIRQYGTIPREDVLKKQWESQILLLLNWEDEKEKGAYTGKIFEYLTGRRPILATGGFGNDVVERLLKETKAGVYCSKVDDIKKYLRDFYSEYKKTGKVSFNGDLKEINKYSYREMAKKFADVLNQTV